ncbi:MAG: DUF2283 domain-containing protein [Candidatus Thermoplasmatota archaeon]|nr:DUF2283 domain-containing protein [Candidatus Thermoplasmatota archaeon]MBS3790445.1 DUF2283 domain-containing protein [Candidatus Thermoplasmatota archaeon]
MRVELDSKNGAFYFRISDGDAVECEEVSEGVILDYDEERNLVGIEISNDGCRVSTKELSKIEIEMTENVV